MAKRPSSNNFRLQQGERIEAKQARHQLWSKLKNKEDELEDEKVANRGGKTEAFGCIKPTADATTQTSTEVRYKYFVKHIFNRQSELSFIPFQPFCDMELMKDSARVIKQHVFDFLL